MTRRSSAAPEGATRASLRTGALTVGADPVAEAPVRVSPRTGELVERDGAPRTAHLAAVPGTMKDRDTQGRRKVQAAKPGRTAMTRRGLVDVTTADAKGAEDAGKGEAPRKARRDAGDTHRTTIGTLTVRDEAGSDGMTIEGIAVPYGEATGIGATREYPGMREAFDAGSFAEALAALGDAPLPIIDEHSGAVVGSATLTDTPEGIAYRGRLLSSQAARDFAERARERLIRPSIEFVIGKTRTAGDTVFHTGVRALSAIAGTYKPAYTGVTMAVREDARGRFPMFCEHCAAPITAGTPCACAGSVQARAAAVASTITTTAERQAVPGAVGLALPARAEMVELAQRAADETLRRHLEGAGSPSTDHYADLRAYRSLGQLVQAAAQPDSSMELRSFAARALADQLTTDTNTGVTGHSVLRDVKGIVARGRRAIEAFGGARPLSGSGMAFTWPYFDGTLTDLVAAQSAEKAEIISAKVQIKQGTENIVTYAGGSDVSYQLIRRSDPAYLDVYARIMLLAYAVVTDIAFVTELESGSATGDFAEALTAVDATELKGLLIDAAVAVETATGAPADFVLASTTAFKAAAKLLTPYPVAGGIGTLDIRGLQVNIGGLPVIHVPSITAGKFIISNREAAGWFEDGPFQASEEDVAKLGRNVAYWGMGVPARFIPAGIIELYDVTP